MCLEYIKELSTLNNKNSSLKRQNNKTDFSKEGKETLIIRENQIEIATWHHYIPTRMVTMKRIKNPKFWRGSETAASCTQCLQEWTMVQPLGKVVQQFLTKLNIH